MFISKFISILERSSALLPLMVCHSLAADWNAGRDLLLNEKPDGAQETLNPNFTVPAWSYGFRMTLALPTVTPYTPAQHSNAAVGGADMEGFTNGTADVLVNTGTAPYQANFGSGPLGAVAPGEIFTSPGSGLEFSIIRWTAPAPGLYGVSAYWQDIDPYGGDGASAHIVVNGVAVYNQLFANTGGASTFLDLTLNAGDLVDFATGARSTYFNDDVRFNAIIVPEPSALVLLLVGGAVALSRRRASCGL